ncbi:hypothetical protein EV175_001839 [Coemansia sp. RSA 1933]|nr:hypothetical protein EV175_001839 [Coemansia sp. RSA 1933]
MAITFAPEIVVQVIMALANCILHFSGPFFLQHILHDIENKDNEGRESDDADFSSAASGVLFNGTIRFNLDPFDEHPDELLWEALRRTHLVHENDSQTGSPLSSVGEDDDNGMSIAEHMAGIFTSLDAEIKENGQNLAQGQRQLVSLARALFSRSRLIIMDEATASVDFDTDHRIQRTIRGPGFANSTLICVAHPLRTVIDYDRVLVLENGNVAEFDTPYDLLQNEDDIFRSLCKKPNEYEYLPRMSASHN